jgi:fructokinase
MILCCGEALIDFLPRKGADGADVYQPFNGGSIYNTAVALGRQGQAVGLFTGISRDFFGDGLIEGLTAAGVSLKFIKRKDRHTTLALVKLLDGQARYSFIDEGSAGRMVEKRDIPKLTKAITAIHFGSFSIIDEPCGTTYETLVKRASKTCAICFDPNIRPTLVKNRKMYLARIYRLMAFADIVKISDEDVLWMTGSRDLTKAAKKFMRKGAKIVVVTRGGEGCEILTRKIHTSLNAPKVIVADTVGAGDTFSAGFYTQLERAGLLNKKSLATISEDQLRGAATFAMRAAAITVSRPGANPPWAKEME